MKKIYKNKVKLNMSMDDLEEPMDLIDKEQEEGEGEDLDITGDNKP